MLTTTPIAGIPTSTIRHLAPDATALVLIIPGNPGVAQLYAPFAAHLFSLGSGRLSVAVASHAGHAPGHRSPDGFFTLADQLAHHRAFLDTLPAAPVVHLIGHSIGAWLLLSLLDGLPEARRGRGLLLFPTIERMAQTPNGVRMAPLFGSLRLPAVQLSRLIHRLPGRDQLLERMLLSDAPIEERPGHLEALRQLAPDSLHNVLCMAGEELQTVTDLPAALLSRHARRLTLYYGTADRWNLPGMARHVAERFPEAEVVRCAAGLSHAFVLDGSEAMAAFAWERLQSHHAHRAD